MRLSKQRFNQMEGGSGFPPPQNKKAMARYYTNLKSNPHFTLRAVLPLLKAAERERKAYEMENAFTMGGVSYSVGFNPFLLELTLQWMEEGRPQRQEIWMAKEPSNIHSLSGTYVYYFLCPRTYSKCRILYKMEGGGFYGRKALTRALYPQQMESRLMRALQYPPEGKEPYRRYGKTHYRGKPTAYGKRCERWERAEERKETALIKSIANLNNRIWH